MKPTPRYKETDVGLIPEDWEIAPLGDLFDISAGGDFDPTVSSDFRDAVYAYPIYSNALTDAGLYGYTASPIHRGGSVTVTARGMIGSANFRNTPFTAIGRVIVMHPRGAHEGRYFATFVNERIDFAIESTGVPQLTAPQISKYQTAVPPLAEQRAIAAALSDADGLIASLDALIAKKRDLKLATMQQLLTGKNRLPGFTDEWKVKRLGEVIEKLIGGGTPSRSNPAFWAKEIPWVTVKDFATYDPYVTQEYISELGLKNSASHLIPKGTLITSTRMALGMAKIYEVDVAINQDLKAVFLKPMASLDFLFHWFAANAQMIDGLGSGSTVKGISVGQLRNLPFLAPPTHAEQTAIAEVLSDMDTELAALEANREKARALKQGMMQELLTGRVRLI